MQMHDPSNYTTILQNVRERYETALTDEWALILGDSSEVCKYIPSDTIHLTFTSPPYDLLRQYNGSIQHYSETVWRNVLTELYRITAPGGVVAWNVADQRSHYRLSQTSFRQALFAAEVGFAHLETIIWDKISSTPLGNHARYMHTQSYEMIFIFVKAPPPRSFTPITVPCKAAGEVRKARKHLWQEPVSNASRLAYKDLVIKDLKNSSNIWQICPQNNALKYGVKHPAVFPESLAIRVISTWSRAGDVVLDPFSGAGTTVAMAALHHRYGIGIEMDNTFYQQSQNYCKQRCQQKLLYA